MNKVFLGLGTNIGDKKKNLDASIDKLSKELLNIKESKRYSTSAWGYTEQDDFLNSCLYAETEVSPAELLEFTQSIEKDIGREKTFKWGPRLIDIDILFFNKEIIKRKDLTIPHPLIHKRNFVLRPLLDLDENFIHPIFKETVKELYQKLNEELPNGDC